MKKILKEQEIVSPGNDPRMPANINIKSYEDSRFYKDLCAPFEGEPTRDRMEVVQSDAKGEGLISLVHINSGQVAFKFFGAFLNEQTLFTLQKSSGLYVEDPFVMGKVLHSCDPNLICDMKTLTFTAIKPIATGDYLTMDYETTEDELYRKFECQCGSQKCKGPIKGRAQSQNQ